ncbi:phage head closure protein [Sulfitobacter donghicola]|uniref:Tail protein n=1 Tax=Sulfitobacter donghicola DSW-25 = KCTC 12864 = JCM 14565 TaxID=1300350 RepID=A0A073IKV0_9RHOB|nr:phage head closure protein [Sulfitobacter donghicola]KEJ90205.1 tail protein [Sulfitobacter donghicola DSW-25 = KCTC 12864 = JCM 14565]KIN66627.1 Head-tail adaptor [Sulfitobacter donghicola DSW-25 = KCTC 12864 = JCM 14565]
MSVPHLNRQLVLEAPNTLSDGAGGLINGWVPVGVLWGEVSMRSGSETARNGARVSQTGFRITVRAAPVGSAQRPQSHQRFREGDRIFTIEAVFEADTTGRYLTCFAQEEKVV